MSGLIAALSWVIFAAWVGYDFGRRHERKAVSNRLAGHHSHVNFVNVLARAACSVRDARKFSGDGPEIKSTGEWTFGGIGRFSITVEEAPEAVL